MTGMTGMNEEQRKALGSLTFDWASALEDVWRPARYHVEGLHAEAASLIRQGIEEAVASTERANPLGLPLQGQRGVGKTHLLGWAREQVRAAGGYFFLLGDLTRKTFWEEARTAFVQQLLPLKDGSRDQLGRLLADLADQAGLQKPVRDAVTGVVPPSSEDVRAFIAALRSLDPSLAPPCLDTARALVLLASPESGHTEIGYSYLDGGDVEAAERRQWGIRNKPNTARFVINQVSRLLALSGPTVVAVDQIDALIDRVGKDGDASMIAEVATGLMDLRDTTFRTFTIISCLPESWDYMRDAAVVTAPDRFRSPCQMQNIPTADIGRHMIAQRFAVDYTRVAFRPPYPTWPIRTRAFDDATGYTARSLLKRIDTHVRECLRQDTAAELDHLSDVGDDTPPTGEVRRGLETEFTALDARFRELWDTADVSAALVPGTEDGLMPDFLDAGLDAWIRERGEADSLVFVRERHPRKNPALHAELRMIIDDHTERQRRWAFRAIAAERATSVLSRLRNATLAVGLDADTANRQLFVLRSTSWPNGRQTEAERAAFTARGGLTIPATIGDLKTFAALRAMLAERHPDLNVWLVARQPAHGTDLLRTALADVVPPESPTSTSTFADGAEEPERTPDANRTGRTVLSPATGDDAAGLLAEGSFQVGARIPGGAPVSLDLAVLRMHTVLFAGNGSGKTVLLRRMVEECALRGVSAIVLDPNNDLARLGDEWPAPPEAWSPGDAQRAAEYLAGTDVVVWTPRRQGGRPLTFRPLPEFAAVRDDPDDLDAAIDAAAGAIAPRVVSSGRRAEEETAVLREALRYYAKSGASDLGGFVDLLDELPEGITSLRKADATAATLAQRLRVAQINDPLFAGEGEPVDPGVLLTPPPGKRARVSVISMIGLPDPAQRQGFVNQLQMALFSWIKKHPARDRPLSGLLVMDEAQEFAPSGRVTACSESTRRLVAQARKYGLGLLFATQAPKGLHNQIPGNAATQFYGRLGSPVQMNAAREVAKAKGGDVPDIARLTRGQFYVGTDGTKFIKTATPLCLSYHPAAPLTEEEVIARARADR
jgi:Helicase HerA, central domain